MTDDVVTASALALVALMHQISHEAAHVTVSVSDVDGNSAPVAIVTRGENPDAYLSYQYHLSAYTPGVSEAQIIGEAARLGAELLHYSAIYHQDHIRAALNLHNCDKAYIEYYIQERNWTTGSSISQLDLEMSDTDILDDFIRWLTRSLIQSANAE